MYTHAKLLDVDPFPLTFAEEQALRLQDRGPTLRQRWHAWRQRASIVSQEKDQD